MVHGSVVAVVSDTIGGEFHHICMVVLFIASRLKLFQLELLMHEPEIVSVVPTVCCACLRFGGLQSAKLRSLLCSGFKFRLRVVFFNVCMASTSSVLVLGDLASAASV